jgi:nucleoside-diphosphate-sugar epimerase
VPDHAERSAASLVQTAGPLVLKFLVARKSTLKNVLILGVNGFIGHHLSKYILAHTDWHIYGMDLQSERVATMLGNPRFHFVEGDITINLEWVEYQVRKCDVILPLVAIATPAVYVRAPLKVFELDFEANLPIIRHCVKYKKRVVFPSTSEVYGACRDKAFDPATSNLVLGPIHEQRWIYSCVKQLLDRIIWGYGQQGLQFTLFRPFNWIGSGLDSMDDAKEGSSRVLTQFLGHIVRGEPIKLVDGGSQTRAFTYIDDAVECLTKIIDNPGGIADGKIYNIGNPANLYSIRQLAQMMIEIALARPEYAPTARHTKIVEVTAMDYYGKGYADIPARVPSIANTMAEIGWAPKTDMRAALSAIFDSYAHALPSASALLSRHP